MVFFWIFLNFFGLLLSSFKFRLANPFQIYFFVWFVLSLGYGLTEDTWIPVSDMFWIFVIIPNFLAFVFLFLAPNNKMGDAVRRGWAIDERVVFALQILIVFSLPFSLLKAMELAGGLSIFTPLGYTQLRSALANEGFGYGVLSYFFIPSVVVSAVTIVLYAKGSVSVGRLCGSLVVSLFFTYLSTARTSVLFFLIVLIVPLIIERIIGFRGLIVSLAVVVFLFIFFALMTGKGVSFDEGFSDNLNSMLDNLRSYTIAPLLALSTIVDDGSPLTFGENSFRLFLMLLNGLGVVQFELVQLNRDYAEVPDLTNVYTVYEAYFLDFSYLGFLIPSLFLIVHFFLYRRAIFRGGGWIFVYAASVYPLIMQFFQDQYFSLLSMWIQVCFWCWFIFRFSGRTVDD